MNPQYIKYDLEFLKGDTFDLVYTAGLYDYIKTYLFDARAIPERAIKNIQVIEEPLGINYFLKIDKN